MKKKKVRLAIVGTGGMGGAHAHEFLLNKDTCELVAACEVDPKRAADFSKKYGIDNVYPDVATLLNETDIDAVSVVTPDAFHAPIAIECLRAGKHVLCEKPLALNYADANKMVQAAKRAQTINMVNFTYRNWSALQGVAEVIKKGKIGELRHVEASYLQAWLVSNAWGEWRTNPTWLWRLSSGHGSLGVLGDVGVHIIDFATYPVGDVKTVFCQLKNFKKAPGNKIEKYKLDANDSALLQVEFKNGAMGTIHMTRWCAGHANRLFLRISGTEGTVEIDSDIATDAYRICAGKNVHTAKWEDVKVAEHPNNHQRFLRSVLNGKQEQPDFARGAAVQKVLDAAFLSDKEKQIVKL